MYRSKTTWKGGVLRGALPWVVLATTLAFALRLYQLNGPGLRWDEGWSLAHASLPWDDLWRVATEEWHPPAYIALLKLWLPAGRDAWSIRFLSVLLGAMAVPLSYMVARAWSGRTRTALLAAGFAATWPLLVYYGQVTRMYALTALAVLAAAWFMLLWQHAPSWRHSLGLILSATLALYTLYHTAWVLAGLWLYAAVMRPRRAPRLLALGLAALALFVPWLLAARATIQARATGGDVLQTLALLRPTLAGLAFNYGTWPWAWAVLAAVLASGLVAGRLTGQQAKRLLLPLFTLGLSVVGVAYSAGSYWFAPRHLVPVAPFLGLALAGALDRLGRLWRPLLPIALIALAVAYWPTSTRFVYEKTLEVVDPFDPTQDYRYLQGRAGPHDLVYFNVLARAGWYESLRGPDNARWSYAMRWDPIVEPLERIVARIERASTEHQRLWFVLYKGNHGPNADLVNWLDANLHPAGGEWQGEMLYLAYAIPNGDWEHTARHDRFDDGISLLGARWTPQASAGGAVALELTWSASGPVGRSYKVFVHAVDADGRVVAQHDGMPNAGRQPTHTWSAGTEVQDRHGLFLPAACPGELYIRVGLYDPQTGQRLRLANGQDMVEVCTLAVEEAPGPVASVGASHTAALPARP